MTEKQLGTTNIRSREWPTHKMAQWTRGTRHSSVILGRLKVLLESFLKRWLTESLGAPSLELKVFGIV